MNKQIYGLIGRKLGHSFSALYFNQKFKEESIPAEYKIFEIPSIEGISKIIEDNPELQGLNVTIPYKQEIIPYLTSFTADAMAIGAVNTLKIIRHSLSDSGEKRVDIIGDNTDAPGFERAISPLIGHISEERRNALVLGQGGASKAIVYALNKLNCKVIKVSRNKANDCLTYSDLNQRIMSEARIIVNCTPLGMWPDVNSAPDIPYSMIMPGSVCFDLVYNPEETLFMKRAKEFGAITSCGLKMLYNQAELAWNFWNNE